jgi:hypothetical protein
MCCDRPLPRGARSVGTGVEAGDPVWRCDETACHAQTTKSCMSPENALTRDWRGLLDSAAVPNGRPQLFSLLKVQISAARFRTSLTLSGTAGLPRLLLRNRPHRWRAVLLRTVEQSIHATKTLLERPGRPGVRPVCPNCGGVRL